MSSSPSARTPVDTLAPRSMPLVGRVRELAMLARLIDETARSAAGEWDRALVDGERAIASARALDQTTLLARLLQWVGGVYLHRGETGDASRLFDEAWRVSGADAVDLAQPFDVHGVLPAYVARVTYLSTVGEHARAIALGQTAMEIADRTGYVAWAVYRLLPSVATSALASEDWDTVTSVRERLAQHASWLAHPIGMAWVAVIDGEFALRDGRPREAVELLQRAVAALEAVPYAFDAANTRLRLARALQQAGDVDEAVHETRAALQLLDTLGAKPAADSARAAPYVGRSRSGITPSPGLRWPYGPRARDPATRRPPSQQQGDRRAPRHFRAYGGDTPGEHLRQGRGARSHGTGRPGARAGAASGVMLVSCTETDYHG